MMNEKLHAYGWTYVNIDDGWEAAERTKQGELLSNEKFLILKAWLIIFIPWDEIRYLFFTGTDNMW